MTTYGEVTQQLTITDTDSKGRKFGYVVAHREVSENGNVVSIASWVQRVVVDKKGDFKDFGYMQASKPFKCVADAFRVGNAEIAKRVEANRKKWIRNGHKVHV